MQNSTHRQNGETFPAAKTDKTISKGKLNLAKKGFIFEKLAAVALNDFSGQRHFPRLSENWNGSF